MKSKLFKKLFPTNLTTILCKFLNLKNIPSYTLPYQCIISLGRQSCAACYNEDNLIPYHQESTSNANKYKFCDGNK